MPWSRDAGRAPTPFSHIPGSALAVPAAQIVRNCVGFLFFLAHQSHTWGGGHLSAVLGENSTVLRQAVSVPEVHVEAAKSIPWESNHEMAQTVSSPYPQGFRALCCEGLCRDERCCVVPLNE